MVQHPARCLHSPPWPATTFRATAITLAVLYHAQGKYAEAEPLYRRALTVLEQSLESRHPNVVACLNNLSMLYHQQGKYAEAGRSIRVELSSSG